MVLESSPAGNARVAQAAARREGDRFEGRYEVLRLGATDRGDEVLVAKDLHTTAMVDVQVVGDGKASPGLDALQSVARRARSLEHPNVVRVRDVGCTAAGETFLVMEHLEGESIAALMERCGPLPWGSVHPLMLQLVRGLSALTDAGLAGRGLGLGALLVTRDVKGAWQLKLQELGELTPAANAAGAGMPLHVRNGQPPSNENATPVSHATLVGSVMYALLSGRMPSSPGRAPAASLRDVPGVDPSLSPDVHALLERLLSPEGAQQYQDLKEIQAALAAVGLDDATRLAAPTVEDGLVPESYDDVAETSLWRDRDAVATTGPEMALASSPPRATAVADLAGKSGGSVDARSMGQSIAQSSSGPEVWELETSVGPRWHGAAVADTTVSPNPLLSPDVRRGDASFFSPTTQGAGGLGHGDAAPVLPAGIRRPADPPSDGAALLPPAQASANMADPEFKGTTRPGGTRSGQDFVLRVPKRPPSRSRIASLVLLTAAGVFAAGCLLWSSVMSERAGTYQAPSVVGANLAQLSMEPAAALGDLNRPRPAERRKPPQPEPFETVATEDFERAESDGATAVQVGASEVWTSASPERAREPRRRSRRRRRKRSGVARARSAMLACGKKHGALEGTSFTVAFDVRGGRATDVRAAAPHARTPLGRCVAEAVRSLARFSNRVHGARTHRVRF